MKIFGFTYIKNGESIGYPYLEAFSCLTEFCDHTYIAVGDSSDETRANIATLPKISIIDTIWEEKMRTSGAIFSQQANIALSELRKHHQEGWAFHLQADQIICEKDFNSLRNDFEQASREGADGLSMRFLHFWGDLQKIAFSKRWFPQTINAVQVQSQGCSVGDSQSLGNCKKVFESDVTVFHYGHALGEKYAETKQRALHRWWHKDSAIDEVMRKSKEKDALEPSLSYLGCHPRWAQKRWNLNVKPIEECWLVGSQDKLSHFLPRIGAKKVHVVKTLSEVPKHAKNKAIILEPSWWETWSHASRVPEAMQWPGAKPWTFEQLLILKLSEKGVPTDLFAG